MNNKLILKAQDAPKLREADFFDRLREIYRKAILDLGNTNFDLEDARAQIISLSETLNKYFPALTIEEVALACERGANGLYGTYYSVSPRAVVEWIKAYQEERRQAMLSKKQENKKLESAKMTRVQKQAAWDEGRKRYLETGEQVPGQARYFLWGVELGYIDPKDKELQSKAIEAARETFAKRRSDADSVKALREISNKMKDETGPAFRAQCRREAVSIIWNSNN